MFPAPTAEWVSLPAVLLELEEDPDTLAVLLYFARRLYCQGEIDVRVTLSTLADHTRVGGETKLRQVLQHCVDQGYLNVVVSSSHEGNTYSLSIRGKEPDTRPVRRQESFLTWITRETTRIVKDTQQLGKTGKPLTDQQRRVKAALWAWCEVFGSGTPCQVSDIVALLSEVGNSPSRLARYFVRYADHQFEESPSEELLRLVKAKHQYLGNNAPRQQTPVPRGREAYAV